MYKKYIKHCLPFSQFCALKKALFEKRNLLWLIIVSRKLQTIQMEIHNIKEFTEAYLITREHTQ